jgi:hypothetical protein
MITAYADERAVQLNDQARRTRAVWCPWDTFLSSHP